MAATLSAFLEYPKNLRFQDQEPDEKVILLLRQHPITNLSWLMICLGLALAPLGAFFAFSAAGVGLERIVPAVFLPTAVLLFYLILLAFGFLSFLHWFFNVYILTDRRIIDLNYRGFLFFDVSEAPLSNVQDVNYRISGGWGVLFNFGDVVIQTAATKALFDFSRVPKPHLVHDKITDFVRTNKREND